ncbi:uncharacterized protein LOC123367147 [Mauremys mutica]|uniref:Ig-like domain-containing protein n=1 Tax=Mauremys mutica TaxID=74926 RepID=A0A9D4B8X6_9SAUR|nr:uncharacterized protein LOC123367147 [Mauremys mutica]KAH1185608.1 hypothetical protein KIL84_018357 [Mauremys mutica]
MKPLVILVMISYFIQLTVTNGAELSIIQYPQDISVSLNSTVLILCEFDYSDKTVIDTEVYWRKDPTCNQPALQPTTSTSDVQKSQVQIKTEQSKKFSILRLDNVQLNDAGMYFCDVRLILPPPVRHKCGSGSRLTVHESKCDGNIRHAKTWWVWFFLLGYSICSSIIIIVFSILQCCKKHRNSSKNTDGICTLPSEWIYDKPSITLNNGFNQEYEDMRLIKTFTHSGRKI